MFLEITEGIPDLTRTLHSLIRIAGEHAREKLVQLARSPLDLSPERRSHLRHDRRHRGDRSRLLEGIAAGQQLVENHPEREDVGAGVAGRSVDLFRRHVAGRPQRRTGLCQGLKVFPSIFVVGAGHRRLGQAKVHDFGVAARGLHDVGGFDVPMDDASLVCLRQSSSDLLGYA